MKIRIDRTLYERILRVRGDATVSRWFNRAAESYLQETQDGMRWVREALAAAEQREAL